MSCVQLNIVVSVLLYFSNVVHGTSPAKLTGSPTDNQFIEIFKSCKIDYATGANETETDAKLLHFSQASNGYSVFSNCITSPGQLPVKDVGNMDMKIKVGLELFDSGAKELEILEPKNIYLYCTFRSYEKTRTTLWDYYCYKNTENNTVMLLQCNEYCYVFNEYGFEVMKNNYTVRRGSSQEQNKYEVHIIRVDETVNLYEKQEVVEKIEDTTIEFFNATGVLVEY